MAKEESPAFQFYPKDYLSDLKTRAMSYKERGMYWELCSHIWLEKLLPAEPQALARILGVPLSEFKKHWPALQSCFRVVDDGRLEHPRLEIERRKQAQYRDGQSDNGRRGAARRWGGRRDGDPMATPSRNDGDPILEPMAKNSSSSPISVSSTTPTKNVGVEHARHATTLIPRRNARRMNEGGVVPLIDTQFGEFVSRVSPKYPDRDAAYDAITAWMRRVDEEVRAAGKSIAADPFKWWDARFKADWPDDSTDMSTGAIVAAMRKVGQ